MKTKLIGNRKGRLEELAREAESDPLINEIVKGENLENQISKDSVLVFADEIYINAIHENQIIEIKRRKHDVTSFTIHNNSLFDSSDTIYHTFGVNEYQEGHKDIGVICSYNNKLYASKNKGIDHAEIFAVAFGKSTIPMQSKVTAMCVHDKKLLAAEKAFIIDIFKNEVFAGSIERWVRSMCSYKGVLYVAVGNEIRKVSNKIAREVVRKRKGNVNALCEMNGRLLDAGSYGIFDTFSDAPLREDIRVDAMIAVPKKLFDDYLEEPNELPF